MQTHEAEAEFLNSSDQRTSYPGGKGLFLSDLLQSFLI